LLLHVVRSGRICCYWSRATSNGHAIELTLRGAAARHGFAALVAQLLDGRRRRRAAEVADHGRGAWRFGGLADGRLGSASSSSRRCALPPLWKQAAFLGKRLPARCAAAF